MALLTKMLTNAGYGLIGGAVGAPLVTGGAFSKYTLICAMVGGFAFALALYLAPSGKADDDD